MTTNCAFPKTKIPLRAGTQQLEPLPDGVKISDVMNEFYHTVNMTPDEMEKFLETPDSIAACQDPGCTEDEKQGRHLGRRVIELLSKRSEHDVTAGDYPGTLLYEGDFEHMHLITNYIKCRKEEFKNRNVVDFERDDDGRQARFCLMNLGYDVLKDPEFAEH